MYYLLHLLTLFFFSFRGLTDGQAQALCLLQVYIELVLKYYNNDDDDDDNNNYY